MKKFIAILSILLVFASCDQSKIAYVNVDEILKEYEGSKKAEAEMKAQSDRMRAELDQLYGQFQQKVQAFQQNTSLSATAKKEKEQELMMEQQQLQQRQQMAQQQMQTEGQQKIEKINEDIESFLTEYAENKGFSFILGTSDQTKTVMYSKDGLDITEEIIDALNVNYGGDDTKEKIGDAAVETTEQKTDSVN